MAASYGGGVGGEQSGSSANSGARKKCVCLAIHSCALGSVYPGLRTPPHNPIHTRSLLSAACHCVV